ncbi:MAG: type II toxin-antitoxin system RelE/ParE family toxin [Cyanobium sp.]
MIRSFRCADTKALAGGWAVPRFQALSPGNRLEALRGDREGQHSIRINGQFRLCFQWSDAGFESPPSHHTW